MGAKRDKNVRKVKLENDILRRYPGLTLVDSDVAPEKFVSEVKKAYRQTILQMASTKVAGRSEILRELMKTMVKIGSNTVTGIGMKSLIDWCCDSGIIKSDAHVRMDADAFQAEGGNRKLKSFLITLVHARNELLSLLAERLDFKKWMPEHYISCGLYRDGWYVRFHSPVRASTGGGKIYRHDKTIEVDGKRYQLWLSRHAMDRVVGRVCGDPDVSVSVLGEFMSHAIFQFAGFGKFQHLLVCYMPTPYRGVCEIYNDEQSNITVIPGQKGDEPVMRYLYFPFVVDGDRIILKSALLPGFYGTPEFSAKEDIVSGRARSMLPKLSEEDWHRARQRTLEFYDRDNESQMVMTGNYMTVAIVFSLLGHPQFYRGEFDMFPIAVTSPQDIGLDR